MEVVILKREELYAAVWERALSTVAASYGISGVALRKICNKMNVPVPPRGHWARLKFGKRVRVPPLPKLKAGEAAEHRLTHRRWRSSEATRIEKQAVEKVTVPEVLDRPHRLVRSSLSALRRSAKTMSRAASTESCLDIAVSQESLDRALRIMDALLKALEANGYMVEVTKPGPPRHGGSQTTPSETRALVKGEWINFSLAERRDQVPDSGESGRPSYRREIVLKSSGQMTLRISNAYWYSRLRQSWSDGKKQRVEDCLGSFVSTIAVISDSLKAARYERERREQESAEAHKRQEEIQKRNEIERRLRYDLGSRAADWAKARKLEEFLNAFEGGMAFRLALSSEMLAISEQWLGWAKEYISCMRREAFELVELRAMPETGPRYQAWTTQRALLTMRDLASYLSTFQINKIDGSSPTLE
jgi:hypothetical protein